MWSSTAREGVGEVRALQALSAVLQGVLSRFESQVLLVLCDNQSVVRALEFGSRTPAVQAQVVQVHMWAMRSSVSIEPRWSGRDSEPMAFSDDGSKLHKLVGTELDPCDFMLSPAAFARISCVCVDVIRGRPVAPPDGPLSGATLVTVRGVGLAHGAPLAGGGEACPSAAREAGAARDAIWWASLRCAPVRAATAAN